ncbi:TonB-dependent receptor [Elizabethkingia anophelis]|nr:TonB-dependent receptor [Elizabethkingia anophelis]
MKINFRKPMLAAVLTLTTASVYYAQQTQDTTKSKSKDIDEVILRGVTDIAKDRKTPVAVSTIKEAQIVERLGNQELPEILKSTPSVYATKGGGGFGDGRVNIRGFDTNNIAVMVNGMPVNDMEGGTVYFSNWQGLSDVTSALQVQRGLGSSKLAIASVGGTMNFITRAADKKREGNVTIGVGNDGYLKSIFSYNTGRSAKGWSASFLMGRTSTDGYVNGTKGEAYNYYFALGYQPNKKHDFQFTFTGSPQWHNQNNFQNTIATAIKYGNGVDRPNRRYNSNWGYMTGEDGIAREYSQSVNWYSKPVAMLNWDWTMDEKSKLSTVLYGSWGRGGGTGVIGAINGTNINSLPKTSDGLIRFDDIVRWNQGGNVADFGANNKTPGVATRTNGLVRRSSINSHDWYGFLTNFQHKINDNWNFSVGLDGRYYYGYHPGLLTGLWGNNKYIEKDNMNIPGGYDVTLVQKPQPSVNPFIKAVKDQSQIVYRNYDGEILWGGVFGQLEYSNDVISAFVQGSASEQGFQRIDNWIIDGVTVQQGQTVNRKTGFKYIFGYNAKAGINFNIDEHNTVFANAGYYSKQPNNYAVYNTPVADGRQTGSQQILNPNLTNEKIAAAELGYRFRSAIFNADVNVYYTSWKDRYQRFSNLSGNDANNKPYSRAFVDATGIQQVHMGAEFEGTLKATDYLTFNMMFSIGNWKYKGNPTGNLFDLNGTPIPINGSSNTATFALDKVKVSDAAQTTGSVGFTLKPVKQLSIFGNWNYYGNYYGGVSFGNDYVVRPDGSITDNAKRGALKYPDYNTTDVGLSYTFNIGKNQRLIITGNVFNLFDATYISDARSSNFVKELSDFSTTTSGGVTTTAQQKYDAYRNNPLNFYKGIDTSNNVYWGFGRTWSASISYRF